MGCTVVANSTVVIVQWQLQLKCLLQGLRSYNAAGHLSQVVHAFGQHAPLQDILTLALQSVTM
jgi:hypothetical protein